MNNIIITVVTYPLPAIVPIILLVFTVGVLFGNNTISLKR